MNHLSRWLFLAALLPVAACSSSPPPVAVTPPPPPPLAPADAMFVNAAAASDAFEVQAGQVAQTKGHSARVKKYSAQMIQAHTQTTQQLTQIAQAKGVTPSATLSPDEQIMLSRLQSDPARSFDRDYMHDNLVSHQMAIKLFQDEIANGQDADLKQFASATLPIIQQHFREAGGRLPRTTAKKAAVS
jgi:putative membrane protein